jgi:hypothetical protein
MKVIKLSGRETAVLRAIENLGSTGHEIIDRTQIHLEDLEDILSALCDVGYVEAYRPGATTPSMQAITGPEVATARFEINPSYALDLKKALMRY